MVAFSLCPQVAFALYTCFPSIFCSPWKKTSLSELGSCPGPHLTLITTLKALSPNVVTWEVEASTYTFRGTQVSLSIRGFQNSLGGKLQILRTPFIGLLLYLSSSILYWCFLESCSRSTICVPVIISGPKSMTAWIQRVFFYQVST